MRSLQISGRNQVAIVEIAPEAMEAGMVRVRVEAVGLCGTDFALTTGTLGLNVLPIIPGHEVVGMVIESGDASLVVGDRVVLDPVFSCKDCWACDHGKPQWCSQVGVIGVVRPGGAREELVLPATQWIRLPSETPVEAAVLVEPAHVVETIIEAIGSDRPERILVIGSGALGLMTISVIKHLWPDTHVCVYDTATEQMLQAQTRGAKPWTPHESDPVDLVIDGVGIPASFDMGTEAVRPGGHIVVYGVPKPGASLPQPNVLFRKNVRLTFSRLYTHRFDQAVAWVTQGVVSPQEVVSNRLTLEDAATFLGGNLWKDPQRWGKTLVIL